MKVSKIIIYQTVYLSNLLPLPRGGLLGEQRRGANPTQCRAKGAKLGPPPNIGEKMDKKGDFFAASSAPRKQCSEKSLFSEILYPPPPD